MKKGHRAVWIGGGAAAGKSTVCKMLSEKYGYAAYYCDSKINEKMACAEPGSAAFIFRQVVKSDSACRAFFDRNVNEIVGAYVAWGREEFETTLDEVEQVSGSSPVIAEGAFQIAPSLMNGRVDPADCVFLFSTPDFQERTWNERTWYLRKR